METLKAMFDTPEQTLEIQDADGIHSATVFSALFGFIQLNNVPEVDAEGVQETVKTVDVVQCL